MFLYIDALLKTEYNYCPPASPEDGGLLTADSPCVRDVPPFFIDPAVIMVATSDGGVEVFDNEDLPKLLADFGDYMESAPLTGYEACVGWYLDQVIIPVICASSLKTGTRSVTRWMRRLDDKWSKTMAFSVERAFLQGWYPASKSDFRDDRINLTLDAALELCNLPSVKDLTPEPEGDMKQAYSVLLARISGINHLYNRYQKVSTKE